MKGKVVLVGGVFDIVHEGHIQFLEKAKKQGDYLVVLLEHDLNITLKKGVGKPINTQDSRAKVLSALRVVDKVIQLPFMESDSDYDQLILKLKPDIIATTSGDKALHHKRRTAKLAGAQVKVVTKLLPAHSTGQIIKRIQSLAS